MTLRRLRLGVVASVLLLSLGGCRARGTGLTFREAPEPDDDIIVDGTPPPAPPAPDASPHALLAVAPSHGPFSGGTIVNLRGNGFTSNVRVWFGDEELPQESVIALSPERVQVVTPPGAAGSVDIVAQNGKDTSTRVVIEEGFIYDAFYADPPSGPTDGGTLIHLYGHGTEWDEETRVTIDREPCEVVDVVSEEELVCRTPAGAAGARTVRVTTEDGVAVDVLDAFSYADTTNGYEGGFSGNALDGTLRVNAFDSMLGNAIAGASVIVGVDEPVVTKTNQRGLATAEGDFKGRVTVTVARDCFNPVTFVDVPVDTLTVYLDPLLTPPCLPPSGEIPSGGGTAGQGATFSGELVWTPRAEFGREGWTNVPSPEGPDERHVAYVFPLAQQATQAFSLPSASSAITPNAGGEFGYRFNMYMRPGNYTLYALAGIENRAKSPSTFTAYSLGIIRGVAGAPGKPAEDVFIRVDLPLDHALDLHVEAPKPTTKGPDRLDVNVAVRVGREGYVLLPSGRTSAFLGREQDLTLVGLPPLSGGLLGARYVVTARASTGASRDVPTSTLGLVGTTSTSEPLLIGPFLEIPALEAPAPNTRWNGRDLAWSQVAGGPAPDLNIVDIASGRARSWRVISPGTRGDARLPDLGAISKELAWQTGPQVMTVTLVRLENFDYASLGERDLAERSWTGSARDVFFSTY